MYICVYWFNISSTFPPGTPIIDKYFSFSNTVVELVPGRKRRYPSINHNYESKSVPGLFFAGTNTHGLDHRKSSGGFIHGFRYTGTGAHWLPVASGLL